jgi:hypothetical protein
MFVIVWKSRVGTCQLRAKIGRSTCVVVDNTEIKKAEVEDAVS